MHLSMNNIHAELQIKEKKNITNNLVRINDKLRASVYK